MKRETNQLSLPIFEFSQWLNKVLFCLFPLLILFLIVVPPASGQYYESKKIDQDDLPEQILGQFMVTFPGAKKMRWTREEERFTEEEESVPYNIFYKVKFKLKKVKKTSVFDNHGNLMETVTVINSRDLPEAVSQGFSQNFAGYGIRKLRMIEKGRAIYFEADVFVNLSIITCIFNSNGQLVEKVKRHREPRRMSGFK